MKRRINDRAGKERMLRKDGRRSEEQRSSQVKPTLVALMRSAIDLQSGSLDESNIGNNARFLWLDTSDNAKFHNWLPVICS